MPKLWSETIEAHRRTVRDAILDAAAALVAEHGLASVTMSQIAGVAGIGRATLYKYFSEVQAILDAWHERQIGRHLNQLAEVRDRVASDGGDAAAQLAAVLEAYALMSHEHSHGHSHQHRGTHARDQNGGSGAHGRYGAELVAFLHRDGGEHVTRARQRLSAFVRDLLAEGASLGTFRQDVAPAELATYCLHALTAAGTAPSKAAVRRLVQVTLDGLRPRAH